ncbi:EAL and HDOD domain-containing protein [Oceanospirillum sediminis]|uniref:HDOD domain-containing protein n=1 Tax=Oceanospirillum sediminis TaxID=2760088 RepID=A0A839ILA9_9GAMM|nr:HDOD domain-containing protein [Oceanospirillum sediminis]MBB1485277.1 HDOD domain-containing protein [Oceanospirillum sediminis]
MEPDNNFCIARQAICDEQLNLVAYELLYRASGDADSASILDPNEATARVTSTAFLDFGLEAIAPKQQIYINMSQYWLNHEELLPVARIRNRVVLQILSDVRIDDELKQNLKAIKEKGYQLALDDYRHDDPRFSLLPLIDIVIVETTQQPLSTIRQVVSTLRHYPVEILAEKIESWQTFDQLKKLGFDYYQGYFLARPENLPPAEPGSNRMIMSRLLTTLLDENSDIKQIEELIAQEPSLYYRLLKFVNSSAYNLPNQVDSLHQAIVYMGLTTLRTLVSILVWSRNSHKAWAILPLLLARAKACELIARDRGMSPADRYFSLGFLSLLDVALDQPIEHLLKEMSLSDEMHQALIAHQGPGAQLLNLVRLWEKGDWVQLQQHPWYDPDKTPELTSQALIWASQTEQAFMQLT